MVSTLPQATTNISILRDTRLAPFAPGRSEIKEMAERFRGTLSYRGADKLKDLELLALAAASLSLGLNPYISEIWAIPGKGLMIGRAGWVKKLDENLTDKGIPWSAQYLDIRPNEYEQYGIPKNAKMARVCELRRRDQIMMYIESLERMRAALPDLPSDQIIAMVGLPPVIRGVGYIMASEAEPGQKGQEGSGYMSWGERCDKRAFAHAAKQTVSLPFGVYGEGDIVDGQLIGAGFDDVQWTPVPETDDEPVETASEPDLDGKHWITDPEVRKRFWRFCKTDLKLTEDEVHEALEAEHIEQFTGTMAEAKAILTDYAREKWTAEDGDTPEGE